MIESLQFLRKEGPHRSFSVKRSCQDQDKQRWADEVNEEDEDVVGKDVQVLRRDRRHPGARAHQDCDDRAAGEVGHVRRQVVVLRLFDVDVLAKHRSNLWLNFFVPAMVDDNDLDLDTDVENDAEHDQGGENVRGKIFILRSTQSTFCYKFLLHKGY